MPVETIDSKGIAILVGARDKNFGIVRMKKDFTFPAPINMGSRGGGRTLWELDKIQVWVKSYEHKKKCGVDYPHQQLDIDMAQQVIRRGWQRGGRAIGRRLLQDTTASGGSV